MKNENILKNKRQQLSTEVISSGSSFLLFSFCEQGRSLCEPDSFFMYWIWTATNILTKTDVELTLASHQKNTLKIISVKELS